MKSENFDYVLKCYKESADDQGVKFELSNVEFKDLVSNFCHQCNSTPTEHVYRKGSGGAFFYNRIEMEDKSKGYIKGNCVSCCGTCVIRKQGFEPAAMRSSKPGYRTNKFLVTGGCGFIGSTIANRLLDQGKEVVVIDNLNSGKRENLKDHVNLTFIDCDLGDWDDLYQNCDMLTHIDTVFHTAAQAGIMPAILDPIQTHTSNVQGTFNLLQMMRIAGIPRIVYSASSSRYGNSEDLPLKETHPVSLMNPYSLTKYVAEEYCNTWSSQYGIDCVSLVYFNVYGPKERLSGDYATVIGKFHRQLLLEGRDLTIVGDGEARRDFTYIDDVVEANLLAQEALVTSPEVVSRNKYNIGTGVNYSINELSEMVLGSLADDIGPLSTVTLPQRPSEAKETLADFSKAKEDLGWTSKISLSKGLESEKEYYKAIYGYNDENSAS